MVAFGCYSLLLFFFPWFHYAVVHIPFQVFFLTVTKITSPWGGWGGQQTPTILWKIFGFKKVILKGTKYLVYWQLQGKSLGNFLPPQTSITVCERSYVIFDFSQPQLGVGLGGDFVGNLGAAVIEFCCKSNEPERQF